jgi:hypothetical protein
MLTWPELSAARPDLADAGRSLLYQFGGVGLAFLGTVRADGGPRVHPICPVLTEAGLFGLIIPSPKLDDLVRDGQYVLHSFPCPDNEDAFYLTGQAERRDDAGVRERVIRQFVGERSFEIPPASLQEQGVVEFLVATCMLTRTTGHGDPDPKHTIWKAPG